MMNGCVVSRRDALDRVGGNQLGGSQRGGFPMKYLLSSEAFNGLGEVTTGRVQEVTIENKATKGVVCY